MSLVSLSFFLFCVLLLLCYWLFPKKIQWIVLLVFSLVFYAFAGIENSFYILITAFSSWLGALWLDNVSQKSKQYIKDNKDNLTIEEKSILKNKTKRKKKLILAGILLLNFGLLCVFKYANFVIGQINTITRLFNTNTTINSLSLIIPLGISFYTFQTMGYLIDVYWEKSEACKNPLKLLLFTSFFPQITQGPISNYQQLSSQLFSEHKFDYQNFAYGFQRMVWGYFKKIAIADMLAPYVQLVFQNYNQYAGITVLIGIFFYSIQIYADFSGYMDIVCGLCRMMGIKLTENFNRPYFSKSIAEYWRRWHISLGNWFKTYLYYPIAVSRWNTKLGRKCNEIFGKSVGKNLPASIALIAVWLTTGLWHGATWGYIAWGGLNGLIIIFSMWMEPVYAFAKSKIKIKESIWKFFQVIRTFILVTFIKVLPEVGSLTAGLGLWKRIFTNHTIPTSFGTLLPFVNKLHLMAIIIGTILMLIFSLIQRKYSVGKLFNKIPTVIRIFILSLIITILIIIAFGLNNVSGGFMYEQF